MWSKCGNDLLTFWQLDWQVWAISPSWNLDALTQMVPLQHWLKRLDKYYKISTLKMQGPVTGSD